MLVCEFLLKLDHVFSCSNFWVEAKGWLADRKHYWFETKDWEGMLK